nr:zinc finger protein 443-like isoform X2 [Leptinotarsa decemlineata]
MRYLQMALSRTSNGTLELQCQQCKERFDELGQFETHMQNLEAHLKVFCKRCKHFIRLEESLFHFDITYSCVLCKLILPKSNFLVHACLHKKTSQASAMKMRRECGICEKIFFTAHDIDRHIREKHSALGANSCKCCNIHFEETEAFFQHITGHSVAIETTPKILETKEIQVPVSIPQKKKRKRKKKSFLCYRKHLR